MDVEMLSVFGILLITVVLFATDRIRLDIYSMCWRLKTDSGKRSVKSWALPS